MDAIILTGGKGTRLKSKIKDIPKTMADINGIPFLEYTLNWLNRERIENVILAVGYKKEYIKNYFGEGYKGIKIIYSEEDEPLGTGGAIKKALERSSNNNIIVMNGDVLARVNLLEMYKKHIKTNATMSIAIKEMKDINRFGTVKIRNDNRIIEFNEKKFSSRGYINAGVYIMKKDIFNNKINQKSFSLEDEYLAKYVAVDKIYAYKYDGNFIDIGVPEDYEKVKEILK